MIEPKIRFVKFSGRNAGPFREFDLSLDNLGFTFVRGINLDEPGSNGSGKSTLFDLFAYVHTGVTTKGPVKNNLINMWYPKDFELKSTFYVGDHKYDVVETRAHSEYGTSLTLFENDEDITPKTKLDDCRVKIMEKMGLSKLEFFSKLYVSQSYNHVMVSGKPSEKKKYLSTYFELEEIISLQDINKRNIQNIVVPDEKHLNEMLTSVKSQIDAIPSADDISDNKRKLVDQLDFVRNTLVSKIGRRDLLSHARVIADERAKWREKLLEIGIYESSLDLSYKYVVDRKPEIDALLSKLSDLRKLSMRRDKVKSELENVHVELSYDELNAKYQENLELLPKLRIRDSKRHRLSELSNITDSLIEVSMDLDQLADERTLFSTNARIAESELSKLVLVQDKCHVCLRPMDPIQKEEMIGQRKEAVAQINAYLSEIEPRIIEASAKLRLVEERMILESELVSMPDGDLQETNRLVAELKSSIDSFNRQNSLLSELRVVEASLADMDHSILHLDESELQIELNNILHKAPILRSARDFFMTNSKCPEFNLNEFALIEEEIRNYDKEFSILSEKSAALSQQETTRDLLNQQLLDIERRLSEMTDERRRHRILSTMSSSLENIKKHKLRRSSEILTRILPEYVKHLFNSRNIELEIADQDDSFELYLSKYGQKMGMNMISGGQGKRIGLAIAFAFAKLSKNPTNLLIVDEPYKDLDPQGRQACYELLQELGIPSILMTSHDTDQSNSNLYDREWCITMERGQSSITEKIINV